MEHNATRIESLEILGDAMDDCERAEALEAAPVDEHDLDSHYADWFARNATLTREGMGTDPMGEPVPAWRFDVIPF